MTALRAIAAGVFYGVADAAIKAVSLGLHRHGVGAVLSGWTVVAAVATFAGFLAFQSALREDGAISAISLMTALAALIALICGVIAFGESLGAHAGAVVAHLGAIAVVLGCVPVLAAAQAQLAAAAEHSGPARGVLQSRRCCRASPQPAANASASTHGPAPGARSCSTAVKRRLRASA